MRLRTPSVQVVNPMKLALVVQDATKMRKRRPGKAAVTAPAAAAVRTQLAGKVWSGRATVGDNTADIEITLAASGRSGLGAKETSTGEDSSGSAIWAVTAAVAGGPFTVTIIQVAVDDKGRAKPDEAPVTIEATLAPNGHMVGMMTIEDQTGAIDLTPR